MDAAGDDEIAVFVRQALAIEEGSEPLEGRFTVVGGESLSRAKAIAEPVTWEPGVSLDTMAARVRKRLTVARQGGTPKVWLCAHERGAKHPTAVLPLEGDPEAKHGLAPDETATMGQALAGVVATLTRANRDMIDRCVQLGDERTEALLLATVGLTELKIRSEVGYGHSVAESIKALAPTLEKAAPNLLAIYLAHGNDEEGAGAAARPDGRLRRRCAALQREAELLFHELKAAHEAGELTPALRTEVMARLAPLAAQFTAAATATAATGAP